MKLHHIGVACLDIRNTIDKVRLLFSITFISNIIFDPEQNVELCMVFVKDGIPIELISGDVVRDFVKKNVLLYHTCWEVPELEKEIARMCSVGCYLISEPKKAVLFDSRRVAFLHTPAGIVELLECNRDQRALDGF